MNPETKKEIRNSGFSLVETLVALGILLLAITAPITSAQQGLSASYYARDQITAFYLAQEALEYVRSVRDTNALNGRSWLQGLDTCFNANRSGTNKCTVDVDQNRVRSCDEDGCKLMKFDTNSGIYNYSTGANSRFTREIYIFQLGSPSEVELDVKVSWRTGSLAPRNFTVKEVMYDWKNIN